MAPTDKMIEAGAKAAYGTVFCNEEDWPDVSGSVGADVYRDAARNCYAAMLAASMPLDWYVSQLGDA
jgi:hypothetical protein